jgi:hypothetical protein
MVELLIPVRAAVLSVHVQKERSLPGDNVSQLGFDLFSHCAIGRCNDACFGDQVEQSVI